MKGTGGGEIVQVQGGHILRATGRKDRHSKVFTAKGPRDRRVRLAAHTAIQFYDVQDRLGYDRPSKAVDWLIKKAKNAIDKLAELPPWNPNDDSVALDAEPDLGSSSMALEQSSSMALEQRSEGSSPYVFQLQKQIDDNPIGNSSFMQPSTEAQCITDSMKLFFPTSSGTSLINFQNYPHDVMSRGSIQTDNLGLSLHTMQEPNRDHKASADEAQFSGSDPLPYDSNYAKTAGWGGNGNGVNRMGFVFSPQAISQHHQIFCQSSTIPQRESLQSNYSHLIHAWNNRSMPTEDHPNAVATDQSSISSSHFVSEFHVPARIQGEEEPRVFSLGPSSSSTISHY